MRTIFLFPAADRDATLTALDSVASPDETGQWTFSDLAWLRVQTASDGLYCDWDAEDIASISAALDGAPEWAIVVDVSVRATPESLLPLLRAVLAHGGLAVDDNSAVPWSVPDIERGERQPPFIAFVRDLDQARKCRSCAPCCDHLAVSDVTDRLSARVRRDFPEQGSADELLRRLAELTDSERFQAAIVLQAAGDLARFDGSAALADMDWRDVLVRGGLADDDWPTRLDQELDPS